MKRSSAIHHTAAAVNRHRWRPGPVALLLTAGIGASGVPAVDAGIVTLAASDGQGTSSFIAPGANWNPPGAPTPQNDYQVGTGVLRTPTAASNVTFGGASLEIDANGVLAMVTGTGGVVTVDDLRLAGGTVANYTGGAGNTQTLAGAATVQAPSTIDARQPGNTIAIRSAVTGTGSVTIASSVSGGALVSYDATAKTYTGGTTIRSGATLRQTVQDALPTAGLVMDDGLLRTNGLNMQIGGLAGAGVVENGGSGSRTLTIDARNGDQTFAGVVRDGAAGTLALVKTGTDTQALSGVNTYTGGTRVSDGALRISNSAGLGAGSGTTIIDGSGTLQLTNGITLVRDVTLEGRAATPNHIDNLAGSNSIATLTLAAGTGDRYQLEVSAGTLRVAGIVGAVNDRTLDLSAAAEGSGTIEGPVAITGIDSTITKSGTGTWSLAGAVSGVDRVEIDDGTLALIGSGAVEGPVTIDLAAGATFDVSDLPSYNLSSGQTLTGKGTVTGNLVVAAGAVLSPSACTPGLGLTGLAPNASSGPYSQSLSNMDDNGIVNGDVGNGTGCLAWYDIAGALVIGADSVLNINVVAGAGLSVASGLDEPVYWLINYSGAVPRSFGSVNGLPAGYSIDYNYNNETVIALVKDSAVPEPTPLALLALSGLGLALRRGRRTSGSRGPSV